MISKRDLIARNNSGISLEIQKQVEEMGKRWERVGVKFDSEAVAANPEIEKQAERVLKFVSLLKDKKR
jgi:hypothetical protein